MKSLLDHFVAAIALIITFPLCLFLAIGIKLTSKGPVFYSHERIGRYGKPFHIYKFRSMYLDAEKNGPELSSKSDERITPLREIHAQDQGSMKSPISLMCLKGICRL